jgi:hypothetical protein
MSAVFNHRTKGNIIKYHVMMTYGEVVVAHQAILWSAIHAGLFTTMERLPGIHWKWCNPLPKPVWTLCKIKKCLALTRNKTLFPSNSPSSLLQYQLSYLSSLHQRIRQLTESVNEPRFTNCQSLLSYH